MEALIPLAYRPMKEKNENRKRLEEMVVIWHADNGQAGFSIL